MEHTIYYFSGTHWDREWYQTFQGFRLKLIDVMDHLIDFLEIHDDIVFHLDGQTIILDDYLEVCAHNKERLERLIKGEKILIGPWYCMPDENLVSGEALIRNLQKGINKCEAWGAKPWGVGYICDIFGHTAQMPQIFNGFGITFGVLGRGTNQSTTQAVFHWDAPDKSRLTMLKLPDKSGYGSFAMDVCGQVQKHSIKDFTTDEFKQTLKEYVDSECKRYPVNMVVVWDAMDHEPIHNNIPEYIAVIHELYPNSKVHTGNLVHAFENIMKHQDNIMARSGELIEPAEGEGLFLHLLINTLSSRHSIKQRNDSCQALLEKVLEPLDVYFFSKGITNNQNILEIAWNNLLMNHPHDSICGCSVDRVHDEMGYRFSQVESITEAVIEQNIEKLTGGVYVIDDTSKTVVILNPLPFSFSIYVEVKLPFAKDYPKWQEPFGYQAICAFRLYDTSGNELLYTITNIECDYNLRLVSEAVTYVDMYTIRLPILFNGLGSVKILVESSSTPVRDFSKTVLADGSLENELIKVSFDKDGKIDLYDKKSGRTYPGLMGITDSGEIGDGWNSVAPVASSVYMGGRLIDFRVLHNSGLMGSVSVKKELMLPEKMEYSQNGIHRSRQLKAAQCEFIYTLFQNERTLHVELHIDNCVKDHVMRLHIPTGITTDSYEVNAPFTFISRETGINPLTKNWKESDKLEKPNAGILIKRDKDNTGIALISEGGIHEGGADNDSLSSLYVTLLRGFSKTLTTNGEEGGQELFEHTYSFAVIPLDAEVGNTELQNKQSIMQTSFDTFVTTEFEQDTLFNVKGAVCYSAMKRNLNGIILRLFNPSDKDETFAVEFKDEYKAVYECDLTETPLTSINYTGNTVTQTLARQKIKTLLFEFDAGRI